MVIERLGSYHDRNSFDCGEDYLNRYLRQQSRQDADRNLSVTYVAVESAGASTILGYYTLSMSSVHPEIVPARRLPPRRAVPVILLGRLGVDRAGQGKGLGELLLMDALRRSQELSREVGTYVVVVDALHGKAKDFYTRYGFRELGDSELHLFLTIADIRSLGLNPGA